MPWPLSGTILWPYPWRGSALCHFTILWLFRLSSAPVQHCSTDCFLLPLLRRRTAEEVSGPGCHFGIFWLPPPCLSMTVLFCSFWPWRTMQLQDWCVRTYVDDNASVKWCPNPVGCQNACEYQGVELWLISAAVSVSTSHRLALTFLLAIGPNPFLLFKEILEIHCPCTFVWCWACGEEAHKPASCKTVNQWNVKNSAESENISWIRAHTKKCPKCSKLRFLDLLLVGLHWMQKRLFWSFWLVGCLGTGV